MIITLASSKGGVGKSTITGCLAGVWAADGDAVHIVDLDNNRTVSRWFADAARRPKNIPGTSACNVSPKMPRRLAARTGL